MLFWGLVLGLPLTAFGALCVAKRETAQAFAHWFEGNRIVAIALTIAAWFWTAHELDIIGIDVFDMVTKRFPGELWILAIVLSYLTIIWMPKNLSVRALTGILMLFPASMFRTTRLLLPESGAGLAHVFVVAGYVGAIVGMYGMFYPWRLEKALDLLLAAPLRARIFGALSVACGLALIGAGLAI